MKRCLTSLALCVIVVCLALPSALAAGKKLPTMKIAEANVVASEELCMNARQAPSRGIVEMLKLDGKRFLLLDVTFTVEWSEDVQNANLDSKDFKLTDDKGNAHTNFGRYDDKGFSKGAAGLWLNRPYNWDKEKKPSSARYQAVFVVPADAKSVEFKVADAASVKLDIPAKTEPPKLPQMREPLLPATEAKIEVLEAALVDEAPGMFRMGKDKHPTRIYNPNGKLLRVKIKHTPLRSNSDMSPDHFFWGTNSLGLLYGDGKYIQVAGEEFMKGFSINVSHNTNMTDGNWRTSENTLYFAVPADLKSFRLTYHMTPVVEGTVGGPFKALEVK